MARALQRDLLLKVRKLAALPDEARQSRFAVSITRLTTLKSLCQEQQVAARFVTYLARKTLERVEEKRGRSSHTERPQQRAHRELMTDALAEKGAWLRKPTEARREGLWDLFVRIREEQNDYRNIKWGAVRVITDANLLLFEYALHCLVNPPHEAGHWAYQTARHYAERSSSSQGSGLTAASAPLVQDIVEFWLQELDIDQESLTTPHRPQKAKARNPSTRSRNHSTRPKPRFTPRQGQFLAFIYLYRRLHRQGPAELDLALFFRLTPPSVHGMIVKLEELGLITREPGVPRSARVVIPTDEISDLEEVHGPPW
jgi:DNA-binding MarR family transcriptional regulator